MKKTQTTLKSFLDLESESESPDESVYEPSKRKS